MKTTTLYLIMGILLISLVSAFDINKGDNVFFNCNNATSGVLLGTTATILCYDSLGNTDVSESMTNVAAGI